jgi:hypothetical protein
MGGTGVVILGYEETQYCRKDTTFWEILLIPTSGLMTQKS